MSRHTFSVDTLEVVVGWDQPLQTFFAHVLVDDDDDGGPVVARRWGVAPLELYELEDLRRALPAWITGAMPDGLELVLYRDRDEGR